MVTLPLASLLEEMLIPACAVTVRLDFATVAASSEATFTPWTWLRLRSSGPAESVSVCASEACAASVTATLVKFACAKPIAPVAVPPLVPAVSPSCRSSSRISKASGAGRPGVRSTATVSCMVTVAVAGTLLRARASPSALSPAASARLIAWVDCMVKPTET